MIRFGLSALLILVLAPLTAAAENPPNLVLIFADDLGWKDVGYQGSIRCETPHIDRLSREGLVFSSGYSGMGNCAPSRACLLSGSYTPRHAVYAVGSTNRGPKRLMRMVPVSNKSGLAPQVVTLAEALRKQGYTTGLFGKWHLAGPDGAEPKEQGFDVYFDSRHPNPNRFRNAPEDPKGIYSLTEAACEFMEANRERPFFCFVSHHAIHTALEARPETLTRTRKRLPRASKNQALYAACTADLDDGVGRLLAKLKELKLQDETLVVFTSDNGATQASPQEPLRGNKGGYYEGGVRVPFIFHWPGRIKPRTTDVPVINLDLYPTFLELAGGDPEPHPQLDGESLTPLFAPEGQLQREAIFWHFPGYLNTAVIRGRDPDFRTRPVSVIRKGDWKLLLYHEEWQLDGGPENAVASNAVELYNLSKDIGERRNLAGENAAKREELLDDLTAWWKQVAAPLPTHKNPNYNP